jgi:ABC-type dipeptide/oligopeptide/nickel transport system permease subunit
LFLALIAVRYFADALPPNINFAGRVISNTMVIMIFVLGLTSWMRLARIVRSVVLSIKQQEYITAARSIGASSWRIVMRHVLPNCFAPVIVSATLGIAQAILLEAYLSFLGLGVRAPTATWGTLMGDARLHLANPDAWYFWFFPAMFISVTVLGINFFGDGVRDAFDPKAVK